MTIASKNGVFTEASINLFSEVDTLYKAHLQNSGLAPSLEKKPISTFRLGSYITST